MPPDVNTCNHFPVLLLQLEDTGIKRLIIFFHGAPIRKHHFKVKEVNGLLSSDYLSDQGTTWGTVLYKICFFFRGEI